MWEGSIEDGHAAITFLCPSTHRHEFRIHSRSRISKCSLQSAICSASALLRSAQCVADLRAGERRERRHMVLSLVRGRRERID